MNKFQFLVISVLLSAFTKNAISQPISLHPENSHYFVYKNKPTVLITSAEHYGAVINLDFDYEKYLHTMRKEGMNYTRLFIGTHIEVGGSFDINHNSLAPEPGKYISPWKSTNEKSLCEGVNKVDLSAWNPDYFERLHGFISLADKLDIIVEITLFCSTYRNNIWERNPFNPGNNINDIPADLNRKKSNTLSNGNLTFHQKNMVKKFVTELNKYDNIFFEIQNEPWIDNPQFAMRMLRTLDTSVKNSKYFKWSETATEESLEWQKLMADVIVETENALQKKHLIAQNFTNFKHSIDYVNPNVSIINFHYAWPEAVWLNYGWEIPVCFDESGFDGDSDTTYLRQAWQFILAGGAMFNNLDYSFYPGKEDGTGENNAPGGGSVNLRKQLAHLRSFIESFDFIKMKPDFEAVYHSPGLQWQAISEPGKQYAIIFTGFAPEWIKLNLPKGEFKYQLISPFTGKIIKSGTIKNKKSGIVKLDMPEFKLLMALKIVR